MRVNNFSNYTKMYESRLQECEFFREQNITADDIIKPLEGLITEEFLDFIMNEGFADWVSDKWEKGKKAAKNIYHNVKDAISSFFGKIVDFFKNFSLSKLIGSIWTKIKEIGAKAWKKVKDALGSLKEFIVGNDLVDQNNKPKFGNIWSTLCQKGKDLIGWDKEGVSPDQLKKAGAAIEINESDAYSIGDDEVKYYGMFEKIAHAMGIKNARFNGVVSQIIKKGTIGVVIMGILKFAGFNLGALTLGLSPVAMAAIAGMVLMAGLIILAIWVCKPYPTVDDCLAYLHIAFGGNCQAAGVTNIFVQDIDIYYANSTSITNTSITNTNVNNTDITNTNVNNTNVNNNVVGVGNGGPLKSSNLRVGQEYIYTSKSGKRIVKIVSLTHDVLSGPDKKWGTGDDKQKEKLKDGYVDVIYQDKNGEYSTSTNFTPVLISKLSPLEEKENNQTKLNVGKEYFYTNKKGEEKRVKLISLTHDTSIGGDKKWLTKDDKSGDTLENGYVSVIYPDRAGKFTNKSPEIAVLRSQLSSKERVEEKLRYISSFEKYNNK